MYMKQISSLVFAISTGLYLVIVSLLTQYSYKAVSGGGKYISEYSEIADLYSPLSLLLLLSILISILFLIITYRRLSTLKIKWKIPIFVCIVILFFLAPSFFGMLAMLVLTMLERKSAADVLDIQSEQKTGLGVHPFFKPSLIKIVSTIFLYAFYFLVWGYAIGLALDAGRLSGSVIEPLYTAAFYVLDWFFLYPLSLVKSGSIQFDTIIVPIILCYLWSCVVCFPFRKKDVGEIW